MTTNRPALLLYCQHSLGIGHLKRSWVLADALSAEFRVVLASGGARPRALCAPSGIETIELPALSQDETGRLLPTEDGASLDQIREQRKRMLVDTYRTLRPSVVLIELFPFGRRKFAVELLALLAAVEDTRRGSEKRPVIATSVRDLLVDRGAEQQKHDDRAARILDAHFDAVLVHTDPRFSTLHETFRPSVAFRTPVHHTGFVVAGDGPERDVVRGTRILVSGGGGRFAAPLYMTAIDAHRCLGRDAPPMTIVAGPLCPDGIVERLRATAEGNDRVRIETTVGDLSAEMRASALSVSQCGYNTALDVLRAGVPALVVPFADNGDSEQTERATRLAQLGAIRMLPAGDLRPDALAAAMRAALGFIPNRTALDFDGGRCTTRLLSAMSAERMPKRSAVASQVDCHV